MLTHLQIRDFAIIDSVELELRSGLTVLTGETGAGKSILVDALQLLSGARAGAEVIRQDAERAEVSGSFDLAHAPRELPRWLEEQAISTTGELILRRVVGNDGRSRAYLNGQSVPLQTLRDAGALLIDIHGQHEFQSLTRAAEQRELLDGYAGLTPLTERVGIVYRDWLERLNRTLELESKAHDRDAKLDLLRYQAQELAALQLKPGEITALAEEHARLTHRGRLAAATQSALGELYDNEPASAHAALSRAQQALRGVAALDPRLATVLPLLDEASIQVREAARELQRYQENLEVDGSRQDEVQRRLAAVEELARKHRVAPTDLPARAQALLTEVQALERADTDLAVLRRELGAALQSYRERAQDLSQRRTAAARNLSEDISARMQILGMAGGRFEADVRQDGNADPTRHGIDSIEFRVTANPGSPPRALGKVASGGELSRLSLAVQVSYAAQEARCMVFDEVDAGIGGAVAEIVGRELRSLGARGQVLCVTHLPQVASQAHHHLRVVKNSDGQSTRTSISVLNEEGRVEELARMLGGIQITTRTREHAQEMLTAAAQAPAAPVTTPPAARAVARRPRVAGPGAPAAGADGARPRPSAPRSRR